MEKSALSFTEMGLIPFVEDGCFINSTGFLCTDVLSNPIRSLYPCVESHRLGAGILEQQPAALAVASSRLCRSFNE